MKEMNKDSTVPDWDQAPEGTTHFLPAGRGHSIPEAIWYKKDAADGEWYCILVGNEHTWYESGSWEENQHDFIPHPGSSVSDNDNDPSNW